jgi:hypothetical protein
MGMGRNLYNNISAFLIPCLDAGIKPFVERQTTTTNWDIATS